jgi:hypothetical protein
MSTRSDIIKQLKTDINESMNIANGYKTDIVECRLGIVSFDQFAQRPAIGYWMYLDEKDEEHYDTTRLRWLNFYLYGYTDDENMTDYEKIYDFADDIETFLMSTDWTYTDNTLLGDVIVSIGGVEEGRAMFDLIIRVAYYQGCDD